MVNNITSYISWILLFAGYIFLMLSQGVSEGVVLSMMLFIFIKTSLIDTKYYIEYEYIPHSLKIILLVFIFVLLDCASYIILLLLHENNQVPNLYSLLILHLIIDFWSLLYFMLKLSSHQLDSKTKIQTESNERISLELSLKTQINPHFVFNTLNNLFSLALKSKDFKVADGISRLSNLVRYLVYETELERIEVMKEINYIKSYIELQKLRISEQDNIKIFFNYMGDYEHLYLPPMLFINFVENAFKYGIALGKESIIDIKFAMINSNTLLFEVRNSINNKVLNQQYTDHKASGFGIQNIRKRLDLYYKEEYDLQIKEQNGFYVVSLKLNVK